MKTVREQGADRTVDQARRQRLLFGRTPFTLEEAAGNASGGIGFFLIVDGQGKKVLSGFCALSRDDGNEHDAVAQADQHRRVCLASDLAGFQRQGVTSIGYRFLDWVWHFVLEIRKQQWPPLKCGHCGLFKYCAARHASELGSW